MILICPHCQGKRELPPDAFDFEPVDGDLWVCKFCVEVCFFGDDGSLRKATKEELLHIKECPDCGKDVRKFQDIIRREQQQIH